MPGTLRSTLLRSVRLMLLSYSTAIYAADEALQSEAELFESLPVVTSATRLEQKLSDTPAAITLIDAEMIRASGAVNIADLFRLVPGFQAYHVNANKFGVVSHGQGSNHPGRLEVMIDGRSVYLSLLSTVDWNALGIAIEDIDYIEVVRGPNVPTQGSNAFLGAINIITRQPLQGQGSTLSATRGSLKTEQYYLSDYGSLGKLDYRLSASFRKNNGTGIGFSDGDPANPPLSIEDQGEISQFSFRTLYTPSLLDSLDIQLGFSSGQNGVGDASHPERITSRDTDSHFQSLIWTRNLDQRTDLKIHAYHNYLKYDQNALLAIPSSFLFPGSPGFDLDVGVEEGIAERYDFELELIRHFSEQTRAVAGTALRYESLQSRNLLGRDDAVEELMLRGFGNLEHRFASAWLINAGAMLEHNDIAGTRLSPRLGLNYQLSPQQTLRASISRAWRTPSLLEANEQLTVVLPTDPALGPFSGAVYDRISQPGSGPDPEAVSNFELGYLWQTADQRQSVDIKLFVEEIDDAIDDFRVATTDLADSEVNENRNVAEWRTRGLELQWKIRPSDDSWMHLAYGYADVEGHYDQGSTLSPLNDATPQHTLAILGGYHFSRTARGSLGFYRQSSVDWNGGTLTRAYNRLDLRVEKDFSINSSNGSVELIVQNLFSSYTEFELNNTFDTRTFLRLTLDLR